MKLTQSRIFFIVFLLAIVLSYSFFQKQRATYASITTFDGCVAAGFPRLETYPEQCKMPGKTFTNPRQKAATAIKKSETVDTVAAHDYKNQTYIIDGTSVEFINGHAEYVSIGTILSATTTSEIIGEPFVFKDPSSTSSTTALIIKSTRTGQKKDFYYITASLQLHDTTTGTNAVYLGEDVNNPSFVYKNGMIVLHYKKLAGAIERHFVIEKNLIKEFLVPVRH